MKPALYAMWGKCTMDTAGFVEKYFFFFLILTTMYLLQEIIITELGFAKHEVIQLQTSARRARVM